MTIISCLSDNQISYKQNLLLARVKLSSGLAACFLKALVFQELVKEHGILKGAVDELISSPLKKIMFTSTDVDSESNDSRDEDKEDDLAQPLQRVELDCSVIK